MELASDQSGSHILYDGSLASKLCYRCDIQSIVIVIASLLLLSLCRYSVLFGAQC